MMKIRLSDFIRSELEQILEAWAGFAQGLAHARHMDESDLRDHAREMLLDISRDLDSGQTDSEQSAKSKGHGPSDENYSWAEVHGGERHSSGFSVMETVSEFRALRASVVSLWTKASPTLSGQQIDDLMRFHEAIDQAVAESLKHYAILKETETRLFSAILSASPDPISVIDLEGRFTHANQATSDLFALDHRQFIGRSTLELGFSFAPKFQLNLKKVVAEQSTYRGNLVHAFAPGKGDRFEYLIATVLDEQKTTEAAVCMFRDVTARVIAEERIWHDAHHDLLTGLPNRRPAAQGRRARRPDHH